MNTLSTFAFKRSIWQPAIMLTLGFWLSASLILDWVIMPTLYFSGMMNEGSFTTAGYAIFWNFNRIELLSAAIVLTGVLALSKTQHNWHPNTIVFAVILLTVSLLETYFLTPNMCAAGVHLNLFATSTIPAAMDLLHGGYWVLDAVKLLIGGILLGQCWRMQAE
ncbi:DUF4149 domain-containing protein [Nostoc spongiaeforme FACHB-130]|uniref:DUF4149 domain-containing protein n=1 Tax=Nostoc spongiaeforme FACHB-130 TaxID=1357510 RepID=A0ABR8FQD1_9NOSO|nr:DUF4149 domain-containing protein [Nostoc spongiaeforme]MBD2593526.1 DUF4149 domain-containing protein [Nostoc spongiaeforme FACHB-130]